MLTLPLSLYPRSTSQTRWLEHLLDGVIELTPFPHTSSISRSSASTNTSTTTKEEASPQGLVKAHKLPVLHERGGGGSGTAGGGGGLGEDMAFTVSRKRFEIRPFSLPPADGDVTAQMGAGAQTGDGVEGVNGGVSLEF